MILRNSVLFLCLSLFSTVVMSQVDHWESVILQGDEWKFQVPDSQPDISWTQLEYEDTSWQSGASGIGYGDGDDETVINPSISLYMRKSFEIVSLEEIASILLDMDYDDGFVAYLNGSEIARSLVSGENPGYNQSADGLHEALLYQGQDPERFEVELSLLKEGENILAVEIHNDNINSSDMTSIPILSVGVNTATIRYREVPDWFDVPVVFREVNLKTSRLPIVVVNTQSGQEIPDEPKITAAMHVIDNGIGQLNALSDTLKNESLDFSGQIQIEIRGSSSACCSPKKQYALTTYDDVGEKENVSLLGLPSENDWILNAFAFDPSLMRDYISYRLARDLGEYASRGIYCELVLNGDYKGVYLIQEKLKADDDRIDINKIDREDNAGKSLTGGYITKADKTEGADVAAWYMENYAGWETAFVHEHPKPTTVTPAQNDYIKEVFFELERTARENDISLTGGYPSIIDIPSFVDFILINELASNADGYQFSTFFHKDRNGKLRAGPVWDFNLTYGNDLFFWGYDRSHTDVWQFDDNENVGAKFWRDLFQDEVFNCHLSKRWKSLTQPQEALHPDQIYHLIDSVSNLLTEASKRDYERWGRVESFDNHIQEMKNWVSFRSTWLTDQLTSGEGCIGEEVPNLVISKIHYHPRTDDGKGEKDIEFIEITNAGEEVIDLTGIYFGGTGLVYQFPDSVYMSEGSSIYLANESDAFAETYGFRPFDEYSRSLDNGGQRLYLLNGFGYLIDEVSYQDEEPWPVAADGEGFYLGLIDLMEDNNDPNNWKAIAIGELPLSHKMVTPVIKVFPNPASEVIQIDAQRVMKSLCIYDIYGRKMIAKQLNGKYAEIQTEGLTRGIYMLDIRTQDNSYQRKLIIK